MKKNLLLFLLALFAAILPATAEERSYTIEFNSSTTAKNVALTDPTVANLIASGSEYVSGLSNASSVYLIANDKGMGLGIQTTDGAGALTLNLSLAGQVEATKIVVNAARYPGSSKEEGYSTYLTVNGTQKSVGSTTPADITYTLSPATYIDEIILATNRQTWIKSVTVYYNYVEPPVQGTITFNPEAGSINHDQEIIISAAKSGAGVSSIEYKIGEDGTYQNYTRPFTLDSFGTVTVYAKATFNDNDVVEEQAVYTIIETPKQPTVTITPNGGSVDTQTLITITATGGVPEPTLEYSIDGGSTYLPYTAPFTLPAGDNIKVIARATNKWYDKVEVTSNKYTVSQIDNSDVLVITRFNGVSLDNPITWKANNASITATQDNSGATYQAIARTVSTSPGFQLSPTTKSGITVFAAPAAKKVENITVTCPTIQRGYSVYTSDSPIAIAEPGSYATMEGVKLAQTVNTAGNVTIPVDAKYFVIIASGNGGSNVLITQVRVNWVNTVPEKPVFSIASGTEVDYGTNVTITVGGAKKVYYTVANEKADGTTTTTDYNQTGSTVTLPIYYNCKITAYGENDVDGEAPDASATYTVKVPKLTADSEGGNVDFGTKVTFKAEGITKYMVTTTLKDAEGKETTSEPVEYDGESYEYDVTNDGNVTVYGVMDGNDYKTNEVSLNFTINIPELTCDVESGVGGNGQVITFKADGATSYKYTVNGGQEVTVEGSELSYKLDSENVVDGKLTLVVTGYLPNGYATDNLTREFTFEVPDEPKFSVASGSAVEYGKEVTVSSQGATSLVYSIEYTKSSDNKENVTDATVEAGSFTFTIENDCMITVKGVNDQGAGDAASATYTVVIPTVTLQPADGTLQIAQKITISADQDVIFTYTVNGETTTTEDYAKSVEVEVFKDATIDDATVTAYATLPNGYVSKPVSTTYSLYQPQGTPAGSISTVTFNGETVTGTTTGNVTTYEVEEGALLELSSQYPAYYDIYVTSYNITGQESNPVLYTEPITVGAMNGRFKVYVVNPKNSEAEQKSEELEYYFKVVEEGNPTYNRVNNDNFDSLVKDGAEIVIGVFATGTKGSVFNFMSTTRNNSSGYYTSVTYESNDPNAVGYSENNNLSLKLTGIPANSMVLTLESAGADNQYYLKSGNLYLNTANSGATGLDFSSTPEAFTFGYANNNATIVSENFKLNYVYNSSRFNAVTSVSTPITVFVKNIPISPVDYTMTFSFGNAAEPQSAPKFRVASTSEEYKPAVIDNGDGSTTYRFVAENVSGNIDLNLEGMSLKAVNETDNGVMEEFYYWEANNTEKVGDPMSGSVEIKNAEGEVIETINFVPYAFVKDGSTIKLIAVDETANAGIATQADDAPAYVDLSTDPNKYCGFTNEYKSAQIDVTLEPFKSATLSFKNTSGDTPTAVGSISVDGAAADGKAEYYTLQGVRVKAENLVPGLYIRLQGKTATKVVIR